MKDFRWYFNRLRAMSIPEIRWRLEQKQVEKTERKTYGKRQIKVTEKVFYRGKGDLAFHEEKLPIAKIRCENGCDKNRTQNRTNTGSKTHTDNFRQDKIMLSDAISLLGGYRYEDYKKDWHAGFQTQRKWPLIFSYDLDYKQRDDIGDARTNWELNRHFQFALLACNCCRTGDTKYVAELSELFMDWNEKNPFLHGISWTSVMEVAIRDINWIYTLGFLMVAEQNAEKEAGRDNGMGRAGEPGAPLQRARVISTLCDQLRVGIINMTCYISRHYSRYSSANNHVIVEAAAMGLAGIVMDCREWLETASDILRIEIPRQNYQDGVNKEVSLHYQSFFMEAVGLLILAMQKNDIRVPQNWRNILIMMSRYLSDCQGNYGETVVFGDDDEGKILDLEGDVCKGTDIWRNVPCVKENIDLKENEMENGKSGKRNHYQYVLQLMSLILPERYVESISDQTLSCLISSEQIEKISGKLYYHNQKNICYPEGGVSILRSEDGRALIGIDHGPLGFGSIAAHGHADALSFQMFLDGEAVFADPGTYIYHIDLENRNAFRKTENHNTITVNEKDQSEILGAFLWGKRAQVELLGHNLMVAGSPLGTSDIMTGIGTGAYTDTDGDKNREKWDQPANEKFFVEAEQDGYAPIMHKRRFAFDGKRRLKIYDMLSGFWEETEFQLCFFIGCGCRAAEKSRGDYEIVTENGSRIKMQVKGEFLKANITDTWFSKAYGTRDKTEKIQISGKAKKDITLMTEIVWETLI